MSAGEGSPQCAENKVWTRSSVASTNRFRMANIDSCCLKDSKSEASHTDADSALREAFKLTFRVAAWDLATNVVAEFAVNRIGVCSQTLQMRLL
jgi:hypothetical protein